MPSPTSEIWVEPIRNVSRQLVRELGFMRSTLAGTNHPAPGVHILIEIGDGNLKTAAQLSTVLNLHISAVEQILRDLIEAGEITEANSSRYDGDKTLSLTPKGYQSLAEINTFARDQVLKALGHMATRDVETVLYGLQTYATSLHAQRTGKANKLSHGVQIVRGYQSGLIARTLQMHMEFYSRTAGFGAYFEYQLANGLADVTSRLQNDQNDVWTAMLEGKIVGTVYIDGQDLGSNRAHLRAFIVDDEIRGGGVGRRLLTEAVAFTERQKFDETHLWTFKGLDAARRLYESFGFLLKEQAEGTQWGEEVVEQLFVRKLGAEMVTMKPVSV